MAKSKKVEVACEPDKTWEHESWARTIIEAQEILNDPEKMKKVKSILKKKKDAIRSVSDLVKLRNEKYGANAKKSEDDEDMED